MLSYTKNMYFRPSVGSLIPITPYIWHFLHKQIPIMSKLMTCADSECRNKESFSTNFSALYDQIFRRKSSDYPKFYEESHIFKKQRTPIDSWCLACNANLGRSNLLGFASGWLCLVGVELVFMFPEKYIELLLKCFMSRGIHAINYKHLSYWEVNEAKIAIVMSRYFPVNINSSDWQIISLNNNITMNRIFTIYFCEYVHSTWNVR